MTTILSTLLLFLISAGIFGKSRASRCEHDWELKKTESIRRKLGERTITSYFYKCRKCGKTKTKVS